MNKQPRNKSHASESVRLTFCGGTGMVTGSNFLLEKDGSWKILVDCGLVQGESFADAANRKDFGYDPASISALFVTHAHLDHVGRIPRLVRAGFRGAIFSTPQTRELAQLVLDDAVGILAEHARDAGVEPLYGADDVQAIWTLWRTAPYHQAIREVDGLTVTFKDAGHILGSSMAELSTDVGKAVFTGDLGNSPAPLLRDTEPLGDIDYLVMESTYGDRNHEPKSECLDTLKNAIISIANSGGTLVIPAFAVDRTQVLLYEINNLVESGKAPSLPVFLDSPMAIKVTEVYRRSQELFNDTVKAQIARGDDIFSFPKLKFTVTSGESSEIESHKGPKIILAGSGMSAGGRVTRHEERYLSDPKSIIMIVGYQAAGTAGRALIEGVKELHIDGRKIKVGARIQAVYGYSAHKDADRLVDFVATAGEGLKRVFVAIGEPKSAMHLAQRLNDELHANAIAPEAGQSFSLEI